jgi:hypothetical protein
MTFALGRRLAPIPYCQKLELALPTVSIGSLRPFKQLHNFRTSCRQTNIWK